MTSTIKKVYKNIYQVEVRLPDSPLKILNSYVIKDGKKGLIIDSGFNREESKIDFLSALDSLDIDLDQSFLVLTHLHSDHVGLAHLFQDKDRPIYASPLDGHMINFYTKKENWQDILDQRKLFGMDENEVKLENHPGYVFGLKKAIDFIVLKDGEKITFGDYEFDILILPGHTPGHLALYDPKEKIFFGGDLVLDPITPNITFWGFEYGDMLAHYLDSLDKIHDLDIRYIFPAHRKIIDNPKERTREIQDHHKRRNLEILAALGEESLTVEEISSKISWRIKENNYYNFPPSQKWFATGETMAHLDYLTKEGLVEQDKINLCLYFKKTKK